MFWENNEKFKYKNLSLISGLPIVINEYILAKKECFGKIVTSK